MIGGIDVSGMGEAGRWGVYQDWACGAQVSLAAERGAAALKYKTPDAMHWAFR